MAKRQKKRAAKRSAAPVGGAGHDLNFAMERQEQGNWCWSAVATSTAHFYRDAAWTQCQVASAVVGGPCCQDPGPCDVQNALDAALAAVQHLYGWAEGHAGWNDVVSEISAGRPIALRIGWVGGGGHFVVIDGYDGAGEQGFVTVRDPDAGTNVVPYRKLRDDYLGAGYWSHTYWTQ
jgi:papain like cysteine protease AvrRpt2